MSQANNKATIEHLRAKIVELILKNPAKAARVLTEWTNSYLKSAAKNLKKVG